MATGHGDPGRGLQTRASWRRNRPILTSDANARYHPVTSCAGASKPWFDPTRIPQREACAQSAGRSRIWIAVDGDLDPHGRRSGSPRTGHRVLFLFFSSSFNNINRLLGRDLMERRYSEKDEAFWRKMVLPEEDRAFLTSAEWKGSYRWFRSENVVCRRCSLAASRPERR